MAVRSSLADVLSARSSLPPALRCGGERCHRAGAQSEKAMRVPSRICTASRLRIPTTGLRFSGHWTPANRRMSQDFSTYLPADAKGERKAPPSYFCGADAGELITNTIAITINTNNTR